LVWPAINYRLNEAKAPDQPIAEEFDIAFTPRTSDYEKIRIFACLFHKYFHKMPEKHITRIICAQNNHFIEKNIFHQHADFIP